MCYFMFTARLRRRRNSPFCADEFIHGYSVAVTCMLYTPYDIKKTVTIRLCDFCDLTSSGRPRALNSGPQTGQSDTMNYTQFAIRRVHT